MVPTLLLLLLFPFGSNAKVDASTGDLVKHFYSISVDAIQPSFLRSRIVVFLGCRVSSKRPIGERLCWWGATRPRRLPYTTRSTFSAELFQLSVSAVLRDDRARKKYIM
jgi:hypothetical protein